MSFPTVAIVGRPNVGKSSYFNAVIGRRIAIVEPTPGVTRDRISVEVEWGKYRFELVDTGGIGIVDEMALDEDIENQIDVALKIADVIIFLVDGRDGLTPLDQQIADSLRKMSKPVVLGVNKIDHPSKQALLGDFYGIGLGEPVALSAKEKFGVQTILDMVVEQLPNPESDDLESSEQFDPELPRIAFVGKRNVGKSTLLNTLAGSKRVIVSDIAGTTRDAVDVEISYRGRDFVAIDTAGIMKKRTVKNSIDFYSQARTDAAIRRADVALFLLDPELSISQVDKKIAMTLAEEGKPCVLVVNKWDLAKDKIATSEFMDYLAHRLHGLHYAPVAFISGLEEFNISPLLDIAFDLTKQGRLRVPTADLNKVIEAAWARRKPGGKQGYKTKIYYATQVDRSPPTFVIFVNDPAMFPSNYRRYVENRLREAFDFSEIPVQVFFRKRKSLYHD